MDYPRKYIKFNPTRSIIAFGLLLGLFISSGEGLRLFPIPTNPVKEESDYNGHSFGKIGYAYALHQFGNSSRHLKSKTYKPTLTDATGSASNAAFPDGHPVIVICPAGTFPLPMSFELSGEHRRFLGRAPPVV